MKQIVEQCQQGDHEAFGQLYTLTYDRLRQMCRRYVSNESTIDDLLHDAYLLIFTKIGSLKDASKADAWMQRVVQNLALAYANHTKQQTVVALDSLQEPPAISETPPPIDYEEIMSLIGQLPESYQRVFRLSVFEGLSHQEIAELLNIEPHTSSADLFRAKEMLRRSLAILLLGLLAIGLPIGLWHLLETTPQPEPPRAEAGKLQKSQKPKEETPEPQKEMLERQETLAQRAIPTSVLPMTPKPIEIDSTATIPTEVITTDTVPTESAPKESAPKEFIPSETDHQNILVETPISPVRTTSDTRNWMLAAAFSGIGNQQSFNLPYGEYGMNDPEMDTITHNRLPLTFSLSVNKMIGRKWAVGTGLQYTRLYSETQEGNTYSWTQKEQRLHYLGIPLRATWYPVNTNRWAVYTSAQTMLEWPIHSTLIRNTYVGGSLLETDKLRLSPSLQWSIGVAAGVEYRLSPVIGIYAEPSLQYFFKTGDAIDSYRTAHPATFSVPIGIRINIPTPSR
jgi:RNA polymerase sigma-70 factor (ECF subfamily)